MKRVFFLVAAVLMWAAARDAAMAQVGSRWQGPYKGSGTKFNSTGRGTPITKPGYSSYRYSTPKPKPIPFQTLPSTDPGRYRSSPSNGSPSIGIHRSKIQDHR